MTLRQGPLKGSLVFPLLASLQGLTQSKKGVWGFPVLSSQPSGFLGRHIPSIPRGRKAKGTHNPDFLRCLGPGVPELKEVWILCNPNPHSVRKRNQEPWRVASLGPPTSSSVLKSSDRKLVPGQQAH